MLVGAALAISLFVHVYDNTGIAPADLAGAMAVARDILQDAGIAVRWDHVERDGDPEIIVRIVRATPQTPPGPLGFSLIDLEQRQGTLATVFADRVASLAAIAGGDARRLLGRAMAHEVAHLLEGTNGHGERGLMRSIWTSIEVQQDHPWDWVLSREEAARLRRGVVARTQRATPPEVIVARKRPQLPSS
jgi:hypothetical protein